MDLLKRLLFSFFIFWSIVIAGIAATATYIGLDDFLDPKYSYYDGTLKDPVVVDKKLEISDVKYIYVYGDSSKKNLIFSIPKIPMSWTYDQLLLSSRITLDQKNILSFLQSTGKMDEQLATTFLLNKSNPKEMREIWGRGFWTASDVISSFPAQGMSVDYTISCDNQYDNNQLIFQDTSMVNIRQTGYWSSHISYNPKLTEALRQYCISHDSLQPRDVDEFREYKKALLEVHNNIDHGFDAYIVKYWNIVRTPRMCFAAFISFILSFFILFQISHLIVFGKIRKNFKFS